MGAPLAMEFQDKILKCVDCGTDFVFTAGEQLVLPGQAVQERTQTLQELQGQAGRCAGKGPRAYVHEDGNADELLTVRQGNNRSVPSDTRRPVLCRECFQQDGASPAPDELPK
jgi:hypothetical protein